MIRIELVIFARAERDESRVSVIHGFSRILNFRFWEYVKLNHGKMLFRQITSFSEPLRDYSNSMIDWSLIFRLQIFYFSEFRIAPSVRRLHELTKNRPVDVVTVNSAILVIWTNFPRETSGHELPLTFWRDDCGDFVKSKHNVALSKYKRRGLSWKIGGRG